MYSFLAVKLNVSKADINEIQKLWGGCSVLQIGHLSVTAAAGVSSDTKLQINISIVMLRVTNSYVVLYNNMAKQIMCFISKHPVLWYVVEWLQFIIYSSLKMNAVSHS